jgi:hypothetical protein
MSKAIAAPPKTFDTNTPMDYKSIPNTNACTAGTLFFKVK